ADRTDLAGRPEVERAAPDEGIDRVEEIAAERLVARGQPGADEGGPLPGQSRALVIGDRAADRQGDRGHFGRGPEAKVDAEGVARLGALLQDLDHPLADAERRLARLLAGAPRQRLGI